MSAILFWKTLNELSLYFLLAHFPATPLGATDSLLARSILISAAAAIGCAVGRTRRPRWRWAALLAIAAVFLRIGWPTDAALMLLPALYGSIMVARRLDGAGYYEFSDQFRFGLKLAAGACALLLVFWSTGALSAHVLPHAVAYAVSGVVALRLLRHGGETRENPGMRIYNLVSIAAVCLAGWAITSEAALSAMKAVLGAIHRWVFTPVMMLLVYLMGAIMSGIWLLLSKINIQTNSEAMEQLFERADQEAERIYEEGAINPIPTDVIVGALVLIAFLLLARMLFRFLRRPKAQRESAIRQTRSAVEEAARRPGAALFGRSAEEKVRAVYRRFLSLLTAEGVGVERSDTTAAIGAKARAALEDPPGEAELRKLYRKARYAPGGVTEADAELAKQALQRIKAHAKNRTR